MDMERIRLSETLELSRIIHGHMRLNNWEVMDKDRLRLIEEVKDLGVTTIDTADIYGNYGNELLLGNALRYNPNLRKELEIVTKCGIMLKSDRYPNRLVKHYNTSYEHIIRSVNNSLMNIGTDYIDLLLIHRPSPYMNYEEITHAFNQLYKEGKVLNFGVSNFKQSQFHTLQKYLKHPLVTNQIEVSPMNLEHFKEGTIDLCQEYEIPPMVWSPLGGGSIFNQDDFRTIRVKNALSKLSERHNGADLDVLIYAWLLSHPVGFMPIVGSGKIARIKRAIQALDIKLSIEEWFLVYEAALGHEVL
jgi:predicted oxidoreductase